MYQGFLSSLKFRISNIETSRSYNCTTGDRKKMGKNKMLDIREAFRCMGIVS